VNATMNVHLDDFPRDVSWEELAALTPGELQVFNSHEARLVLPGGGSARVRRVGFIAINAASNDYDLVITVALAWARAIGAAEIEVDAPQFVGSLPA